MDSEYQKKIEILMEDIICCEASLISLKHEKLRADKQYEREKANLETAIKNNQHRMAILKQTGCAGQSPENQTTDVDNWIEEEVEKEHKRWKNLTPEEKMKEHKERIDMLREAEKQRWNCS